MRPPWLHLFYPIVPDIVWLKRLLPQGIKTVQLRLKNRPQTDIRSEIAIALELTAKASCELIVNDYWEEALEAGASSIHLGQEDLAAADIRAIKKAGMKLGISTHDKKELETALEADPDYIALGPIYETKLKAMKWAPQGLDKVSEWKKRIGSLPLVAIGGITPERAGGVVAAGADSVAVITDFITAPHPEARVKLWMDWAQSAAQSQQQSQ